MAKKILQLNNLASAPPKLSKRDIYLGHLESIAEDHSQGGTARVAALAILLKETDKALPENDKAISIEFSTSGEKLPEAATA